jgi:hypothetical protein
MARSSALTSELRERIELDLADGIPIAVVAQNVGVGRSTLAGWLAAGRVARRPHPRRLELVYESPPEGASGPSLEERLAAAEPGLVAAIVKAAERGSWQSAAWLLERIAPERWGRPSRSERPLEPRAPSSPLIDPEDPFAEVLELAAARRRRRRREEWR